MLYYIKALLFTELAECAVSGIQSRDLKWTGYVFLINLLTNPLVNALYRGAFPLVSVPMNYVLLLILELIVVFVEGFLVFRLRKAGGFKVKELTFARSLLYSFMLNAFSFSVGLVIAGTGGL